MEENLGKPDVQEDKNINELKKKTTTGTNFLKIKGLINLMVNAVAIRFLT